MSALDPISEFREDHRKVRDGLLEIINALQRKEVARARDILGGINVLVGPHFRYEEEDLYPTLKVFLGEYVDQLLKEHDRVIQTASACAQLLQKDHLSDQEARDAAAAARGLLVHVSNCDGLAILTERLDKNRIGELANALVKAREAGLPLLDWAATRRSRGIGAAETSRAG